MSSLFTFSKTMLNTSQSNFALQISYSFPTFLKLFIILKTKFSQKRLKNNDIKDSNSKKNGEKIKCVIEIHFTAKVQKNMFKSFKSIFWTFWKFLLLKCLISRTTYSKISKIEQKMGQNIGMNFFLSFLSYFTFRKLQNKAPGQNFTSSHLLLYNIKILQKNYQI